MSNDITSMFTKQRKKECGRGTLFKNEKITNISPQEYGEFRKKRKKR